MAVFGFHVALIWSISALIWDPRWVITSALISHYAKVDSLYLDSQFTELIVVSLGT